MGYKVKWSKTFEGYQSGDRLFRIRKIAGADLRWGQPWELTYRERVYRFRRLRDAKLAVFEYLKTLENNLKFEADAFSQIANRVFAAGEWRRGTVSYFLAALADAGWVATHTFAPSSSAYETIWTHPEIARDNMQKCMLGWIFCDLYRLRPEFEETETLSLYRFCVGRMGNTATYTIQPAADASPEAEPIPAVLSTVPAARALVEAAGEFQELSAAHSAGLAGSSLDGKRKN